MRTRLREADWRKEEHRIVTFCLAHLRTSRGGKVPIHEIFEAYQMWLMECHGEMTKLSIDGFGRLFPRHYKRKTVGTPLGTRKAVLGVEIT